ncbi:MAG TPA: hypothetical protein VG389_03600, partial [Myxococcota bacterium]|nr:hypothetical protein [Myxococcota bacterium]
FPTALRAHGYPGGPDLLFVLSSNFDLSLSGGSLATIDIGIAEEVGALCAGAGGAGGVCLGYGAQGYPRIHSGAVMNCLDAVRVSSFARDLALSADGLNLYAPSGGDDSLTWVEVHPERATDPRGDGRGVLSCYAAAGAAPDLDALLAANAQQGCPGGDLGDLDVFSVPVCNDLHRPRPALANDYEDYCADPTNPNHTPPPVGLDPCPLEHMPGAPFAVALSADGRLAHVTHLDSGALSVFQIVGGVGPGDDGRPSYVNTFDSVDLANGVSFHPTSALVFVTGRSAVNAAAGTRLAVYETAAIADEPEPFLPPPDAAEGADAPPPAVDPHVTTLSIAADAGHDLRGITFSADGTRGYLVERSAGGDVLVVLDTAGVMRGDFVMPPMAAVAVGKGAQNVALIEGALPSGGRLVLVSCFTDDSIYMVDDAVMEVVGVVKVDRGPFGMALWTPDGAAAPRRLFVSSFTAATVSAVDVEPASPSFGEVRYAIGPPRESEQ